MTTKDTVEGYFSFDSAPFPSDAERVPHAIR
jgi:hypothetical protein